MTQSPVTAVRGQTRCQTAPPRHSASLEAAGAVEEDVWSWDRGAGACDSHWCIVAPTDSTNYKKKDLSGFFSIELAQKKHTCRETNKQNKSVLWEVWWKSWKWIPFARTCAHTITHTRTQTESHPLPPTHHFPPLLLPSDPSSRGCRSGKLNFSDEKLFSSPLSSLLLLPLLYSLALLPSIL